jgi:enamine deaminase RidA (YjgF/YER057c/UK114 family)
VADGASAVLRERLGERGAVARSAVGVRTLPSGAPVEVELVAAVTPPG